jgi:homopolymeric O-antigen transport system ATP-binding protein
MITVQNASKLYRIYDKPSGRLKEILLRGRRKYHRDFWAIEDVSLEVETGEAVGVIGRNGAGKTTLLQIIAGVLQPTRGSVSVEGRVTALLELGSGFNPEYTGRENILLSGQILGFSEEEMRRRMDVIVRFAELEGFIDQPVKTYSTGMLMRLAFASAIHVDPDVLIVDEALSVGDVYFQRKSLDRMEYFRKAGKTVLFVSHEPTLVQRFCARALWLEQGRVAMVGDAKEVVTSYQAFCARLEEERLRDSARAGGIASREHDDILRQLRLTGSRWGNGRIKFAGVEMINSRREPAWILKTGEEVTIRLSVEADDDYPAPVFAIDVYRFDGVFVGSVNNIDTHPTPLPVKKGTNTLDLWLHSLDLPYNSYFLSLKAYTEDGGPDWKDPADIHNQMYQFDVVTDRLIHGLMRFDAEWRGDTMNGPKQEPVAPRQESFIQ